MNRFQSDARFRTVVQRTMSHPPWPWLLLVCSLSVTVACAPKKHLLKTTKPITSKAQIKELSKPSKKLEDTAKAGSSRPSQAARTISRAPSLSKPSEKNESPFAHVVLVNGGLSRRANFFSHYQHLTLMRKALLRRGVPDRKITIFSSDGENNNPDLVVQSAPSLLEEILFKHRRESFLVFPQRKLINTVIPGKTLRPSRSYEMYRFFRSLPRRLYNSSAQNRPVLVFVTDHGQKNRSNTRNNHISLWGENLNVRQYHRMLRPLGQRRVISVMSQCYSGGFAWSNYTQPGVLSVPKGNRCGFYSTTPLRPAYGCYPDTSKQAFVGHAHRFAQAMRKATSLEEAHRLVNLTDKTPDIPLRSSDSYLLELLRREARRRNMGYYHLADLLLTRYRRKSYPGQSKDTELLQSIAKRFNFTTPRSLRQTSRWLRSAEQSQKGSARLRSNWREAYTTLRNVYLSKWYKQNHSLFGQLRERYIEYSQNISLRRYISRDRTVQRLRTGFPSYMKSKPKALGRVKRLYDKLKSTHRFVFWTQVKMAVIQRMERQLLRIAGRLMLHYEPSGALQRHRRGLENLMACEATPLGTGQPNPIRALPSIKPNRAPHHSWLGVSYQPARPGRGQRLTSGSVRVSGVFMNTPAAQGGIQAGDYLLGTNGKDLIHSYDLRERVMFHPIHKPFVLRIMRRGRILQKTVKLQRTYGLQKMKLPPILGKQLGGWNPLQALPSSSPLPRLSSTPSLVFFWATWCGPCKAALPTLRAYQKRYARHGLRIVTVSPEKKKVIATWLKRNPNRMPFVNAQDPNGVFSLLLRITATPTFLFVKNGRVLFSHRGFMRMNRLERAIRKHLSKSGS